MRTVWKYTFDLSRREFTRVLEIPEGSLVRHVGAQGDSVCMWIEVTPSDEWDRVLRVFKVVGTGHEVPPRSTYVGSCQMREYVWHVYEVTAGPPQQ